MRKKVLVLFMAVCMIVGMVPATTFAAECESCSLTEGHEDGCPMAVTVHTIEQLTTALDLTTQETVDKLTTQGWAWNKESKTLTLDGLDLVADAEAAITVPADTTIILADGSDNSIITTASGGRGILCAGNMTMKTADGSVTDGKLTIKAENGTTCGIVLKDKPEYNTVVFSFFGVSLDVTSRRGIQMLIDDNDKTQKRVYSIELDDVNYTFANNAGVTNYRSLQVWTDDYGDASITLKNSNVFAAGDIYVYGNGAGSYTAFNMIDSTLTSTGVIAATNGKQIIATIDNSVINANYLQLSRWNGGADFTQLNVNESTLKLGPVNASNGAIEVGVNGTVKAEANLKNSYIIAYNNTQAAISVSRVPTEEEKELNTSQNPNAGYEAARGDLNIENSTMFVAGVKDFTHTEKYNHATGDHITSVVYPSVTTTTTETGNISMSIPENNTKDTVIHAGDVDYTITGACTLEVDPKTGNMTVPAQTELKMYAGTKISSDGIMTFEPGHVVTMPVGVATTVTVINGSGGETTVEITPVAEAPLYVDENGNIQIPADATVKINGGAPIKVEKESTVDKNGNLVEKDESTTQQLPDSDPINATYGEKITFSVKVEKVPNVRAIAHDNIGFYYGETLLGHVSVVYDDDTKTSGTASFEYDTLRGIIPVGEDNIVDVNYGGNMTLLNSTGQITVNLAPRTIEAGETEDVNGTIVTGPATVDQNGFTVKETGKVTMNGKEYTVTKGQVFVNHEGVVTVPKDAIITTGNGVSITGPATIDGDGNITGGTIISDNVKVDDKKNVDKATGVPDTGDHSPIFIYSIVMVISLGIIFMLLVGRKSK